MKKIAIAAAVVTAAGLFPGAASAQDAAAGQDVFNNRCTGRHTANQGSPHGQGPNLFGVFGAEIGGRDNGYSYSDALAAKDGVWDEANLDTWLTSPTDFVSGTRMRISGVGNAEDRANLIAFLSSLQ